MPGAEVVLEVPLFGELLERRRCWAHGRRWVNKLSEIIAGGIIFVKTLVPFPLWFSLYSVSHKSEERGSECFWLGQQNVPCLEGASQKAKQEAWQSKE